MMQDATPDRCKYGSLLEEFAVAERNSINLVVNQVEDNVIYHMITSKYAHNNTQTQASLSRFTSK